MEGLAPPKGIYYIQGMGQNKESMFSRIRSAVDQLNPGAEVILFGSRARGEETNKSDWDVLILVRSPKVTREVEMKYREQLFRIELETGETISTFVFAKQEWETRHSVTPFYENVQKEGIHL